MLALLAGVLLAAAFEPFGVALVVPPAVAVLVLCVRGLPARWGWVPGLAFGIGFEYALLVWMRVVGWSAYLALAAFTAVYLAVLGAALARLVRLPAWPVWCAVAWVCCEGARSAFPFGGFPWGRLAFASIDTVWAASLPWLGATGTSLLMALSGTVLAWLVVEARAGRLRAPAGRGWAGGAVTALVLLTAAPHVADVPFHDAGQRRVAAVQGDVPGAGDDILADFHQVTQNHVDVTERLAREVAAGRESRPDFVLWPENSTAEDPFTRATTAGQVRAASAAVGLPILVGAIVDAPRDGQVLNQGIVWDPVTGAGDRYTKRHPVPFGEYVPFRSAGIADYVAQLALVPRDMLAGTRTEPLRIGRGDRTTRVADAICFDVGYDDGLYAQVRQGGQLVVVQTSNAMFIRTHQIDQQFEMSRVRAVETGRYVVVAAVNGVSGIIRPDGSVMTAAAPRTQALLTGTVRLAGTTTPAVHVGPALGVVGWVLLVVGLLATWLPYRRALTPRPAAGPAARSRDRLGTVEEPPPAVGDDGRSAG